MTKTEATKLTVWLATLYDVPAWTEDRIRAFAAEIADLDNEAATTAARQWVRTHRERPQPSDIRGLVVDERLQMPGPEEACGELFDAIAHCRQQPQFSHEAISEAFRLTGRSWEQVRLLDYDQYPWLRRDFLSCYRETVERLEWRTRTNTGAALPDSEVRALLDEIGKKI